MARTRVLLVDDDEALLDTFALALRPHGFDVVTTSVPAEAEALAVGCDVVVTDLRMPAVHGLALARRLCARPDPPAVIVLTGFGQLDDAVRALRLGVADFLAKPVAVDDLADAIRRAAGLRARATPRPTEPAEASDDRGLIGDAPVMQRLRERIARFGPLSGTVLVRGETGSGKERVAHALHAASRRSRAPMVSLNCATLPEGLADSELFGHVRGAFTDARSDRPGLFREAHGGTLFLDEIGDLPLALQPKLLRVLEARAVRPVGGVTEQPVDVRVIAATHRDLADRVRDGQFRDDLYFRLQELEIEVPALRERDGDVRVLSERFLAAVARREGLQVHGFTDAAFDCLSAWTWPGNVRELEHVVYQAAVLCDGARIDVTDLPARLHRTSAGAGAAPAQPADDLDGLLSLDAVEQAHIERVLAAVGGNRSEAARLLGRDRKTLYRKLKGT